MSNSLYKTTASDRSLQNVTGVIPVLPKVADLSLICFTLLTQSAVGLVFITTVGHWFGSAIQADISFRSMALALGITSSGPPGSPVPSGRTAPGTPCPAQPGHFMAEPGSAAGADFRRCPGSWRSWPTLLGSPATRIILEFAAACWAAPHSGP